MVKKQCEFRSDEEERRLLPILDKLLSELKDSELKIHDTLHQKNKQRFEFEVEKIIQYIKNSGEVLRHESARETLAKMEQDTKVFNTQNHLLNKITNQILKKTDYKFVEGGNSYSVKVFDKFLT